MMTTHRIVQISNLLDSVTARSNLLRRCASKAAAIANRSAAIHFVNRAQKCDSIATRCYLYLGRDHYQQSKVNSHER